MTLPASGNSISFQQIETEFGGSHPISMNEYGDKIGLTVGTTSTHSISSFFGLSASADIHSTTFKPKYASQFIGFATAYYSGFGTVADGNGTNPGGTATDDTFPNSGTFSDGTTTHSTNGVIIAGVFGFSINSATHAHDIVLKMRQASGGAIANGGWTSIEVYANTTGSGTPLLSLNRTDATYTSSDGLSPANSIWNWDAADVTSTYPFSNFFGTNTSLPGSATHLFKLI